MRALLCSNYRFVRYIPISQATLVGLLPVKTHHHHYVSVGFIIVVLTDIQNFQFQQQQQYDCVLLIASVRLTEDKTYKVCKSLPFSRLPFSSDSKLCFELNAFSLSFLKRCLNIPHFWTLFLFAFLCVCERLIANFSKTIHQHRRIWTKFLMIFFLKHCDQKNC